jgi:hypothetical protein
MSLTISKMLQKYNETRSVDEPLQAEPHPDDCTMVDVQDAEWSQLRSCLQKMEHAVHRLASDEILSQTEYSRSQLKALPDPQCTTLDLDTQPLQEPTVTTINKHRIKKLDFSSFIPGFSFTPAPVPALAPPHIPAAALPARHLRAPAAPPSCPAPAAAHSVVVRHFPDDFAPGVGRDTPPFELCGGVWLLRLFPGGLAPATADSLAVFLCCAGGAVALPRIVSYVVVLAAPDGRELRRDAFLASTFAAPGQGRGWDAFLPRRALLDACPDGCFRLTVAIRPEGPAPAPHRSPAAPAAAAAIPLRHLPAHSAPLRVSDLRDPAGGGAAAPPHAQGADAAARRRALWRPVGVRSPGPRAASPGVLERGPRCAPGRSSFDSPYFAPSSRLADSFLRAAAAAAGRHSAAAAAPLRPASATPAAAAARANASHDRLRRPVHGTLARETGLAPPGSDGGGPGRAVFRATGARPHSAPPQRS